MTPHFNSFDLCAVRPSWQSQILFVNQPTAVLTTYFIPFKPLSKQLMQGETTLALEDINNPLCAAGIPLYYTKGWLRSVMSINAYIPLKTVTQRNKPLNFKLLIKAIGRAKLAAEILPDAQFHLPMFDLTGATCTAAEVLECLYALPDNVHVYMINKE